MTIGTGGDMFSIFVYILHKTVRLTGAQSWHEIPSLKCEILVYIRKIGNFQVRNKLRYHIKKNPFLF